MKAFITIILVLAILTIPVTAEDSGFLTNIPVWAGVESSWRETEDGYTDGDEQTVFDFAVSDTYISGDKSFVYEAEIERVSGYGFGMIIGVKNKSSRQDILNDYTYFMVDPGSIVYNSRNASVAGRPLSEAEKDPKYIDANQTAKRYKLTAKYDKTTETLSFYMDYSLIGSITGKDNIKGYIGLMAHDANVLVKTAEYFDENSETWGFTTNIPDLAGIESTWTETDDGLNDGEQTLYDFAVSNVKLDGTKSFVCTAEIERISGYGFGIALGIKDKSSIAAVRNGYTIFIVDPANVYYTIYANTQITHGPIGRALNEDELCKKTEQDYHLARKYTFRIEYHKDTSATDFYLNDSLVASHTEADAITGYLGLLAYDSNITIKRFNLTIAEEPGTEVNAETYDNSNIAVIFIFVLISGCCLCVLIKRGLGKGGEQND